MPSAEPSPRPWHIADGMQETIVDDRNNIVANASNNATAALIVDAVNTIAEFEAARMEFPDFRPVIIAAGQRDAAIAERDRLRDIVRNAVETLEQVYKHADMTDALREVVVETQREARAAIGEDAP